MPRTNAPRWSESTSRGWLCVMSLGLAVLGGCAQPPATDSKATPNRSAASTATPSQRAAPAAPQPVAGAQPLEAAVGDEGPTISTNDPEALAEYIREQIRLQSAGGQSAPLAAAQADKTASPVQPAKTGARAAPPTAGSHPPDAASITSPAGTANQATPDGSASTGTPHMELNPTEFDFKEAWQGSPAEGELTIKNVGTAPLTLDTRSSCGCTVATKPKSPLQPGESTAFKVTYNTSHAGVANKTVTITTNDPEQASVAVKVTGTVKALVAASPSDRLVFNNLESDSVESQTVRLATKYDSPLNLKLRENQNSEPFTVALEEVEPGKRYDLTVTTKPPLRPNANATTVVLETGLEKVPTVPVYVTANVTPQVAVAPSRLTVGAATTQPTQQMVQVQSRTAVPVQITEVKASLDAVKWEILPPEEPAAESKLRSQRLRVTLPAYDDLPKTGATLQVFTDAADEQYRKLDVAIVKAPARPLARPPVRPATGKKP